MHKAVPCEPKHHKRMVFLFDPFDLRLIAARQAYLEELRQRSLKREAEHERIMEGIRIETEKIIAKRLEYEAQTAKLQQELDELHRKNYELRVNQESSRPVQA
jgi:hypothetical protein